MATDTKLESPAYEEHALHALDPDSRFAYVMALNLNPQTEYKDGVIRCIMSREGDVAVNGFIDRSQLYKVRRIDDDHFEITDPLHIKDEADLIRGITPEGFEMIGFEDPDLIYEEGQLHMYFTIAIVNEEHGVTLVYLGHANGPDIDSLVMTMPVLMVDEDNAGAKEVVIAPVAKDGIRRNLVESFAPGDGVAYSTVRLAYAETLSGPWQFGAHLFHPAEWNIPWAGGHGSPASLLPRSFIDIGEGKLVGLMNGREADRKEGETVVFKMFSIGLYIYEYEEGKILWVSPKPLIIDSEARTITFASQFIDHGNGAGTLYAHVDDAFVRAYTLYADGIKALLPGDAYAK